MTAQRRPLDDRLIEAAIARRAPGHADAALLAEIMAAAGASRRVRGWPALPRLSRPAWVALAALLLVAAALVATLVGSQPPLPPIPRASASPGLPSQPVTVVVPSANPTVRHCGA